MFQNAHFSAISVLGMLLLQPLAGAAQATQSVSGNKPSAPLSTALMVTVAGKASTFSVVDLKAMPQKSVSVHNEHTNADETYSGVLLSDILARCGFVADKSSQRTMLRSYIVAEGTDRYQVLYSATEVEGTDHAADVLVATAVNGKDLGADGQLKLIDTADKKPERWVRNLNVITLKSID